MSQVGIFPGHQFLHKTKHTLIGLAVPICNYL